MYDRIERVFEQPVREFVLVRLNVGLLVQVDRFLDRNVRILDVQLQGQAETQQCQPGCGSLTGNPRVAALHLTAPCGSLSRCVHSSSSSVQSGSYSYAVSQKLSGSSPASTLV